MAATQVSTERIIAFLRQPVSYPHQPPTVAIRQTHASVLAIAPPFVYKVKKHVDLGFMDFTGLQQRKRNCERERRLNSRLCPDLYLDVVPIALHHDQLSFGTQGRIVEYALRMKQLPEGGFLDQLLARGQLSPAVLDQVLAVLQQFYASHPPQAFVAAYGGRERIRQTVEENLATLQQQAADTVHPVALAAIRAYCCRFFEEKSALFAQRVQQHRIRDCHGDLHLDHIHLCQDQVCIFDCIEFNDRFRYIDVASDIAFLAMDLDYHERPDLAHYVSSRMAELLQDPDMNLLMDFYKTCRACVRAMVEGIRSGEGEVPAAERQLSRQAAQRYLGLALGYGLFGSRPAVLLVCGRSGSGKSTLAQSLAALLGWKYASSDVTRKEISGLTLYQHVDQHLRPGLYSQPVTDQVYQVLLDQTLAQIQGHHPIVVDATFGQAKHRALFQQALNALQVPYYFLEMQASDEVIKQRMAQRDKSHQVVSDARLEDFDLLRRIYQEPKEVVPAHLLHIDAGPQTGLILAQVLQRLSRNNSQNPQPVQNPKT
jgi:uncharacterized protein